MYMYSITILIHVCIYYNMYMYILFMICNCIIDLYKTIVYVHVYLSSTCTSYLMTACLDQKATDSSYCARSSDTPLPPSFLGSAFLQGGAQK